MQAANIFHYFAHSMVAINGGGTRSILLHSINMIFHGVRDLDTLFKRLFNDADLRSIIFSGLRPQRGTWESISIT